MPNHHLTDRLRELATRRHPDEIWEVALVRLPPAAFIEEPPDEASYPVIGVCASTSGLIVTSEPAYPHQLPSNALVEMLEHLALEHDLGDNGPLNYLPTAVHIAEPLDEFTRDLQSTLLDLGVAVEVKPSLPYIEAFLTVAEQEAAAMTEAPSKAPGIMSPKGMTVERVRAFADAAEAFFRDEPWERFPIEILWRVKPRPRSASLSHFTIMGGAGREFGIGFLPSVRMMLRMQCTHPSEMFGETKLTIWGMTAASDDYLPGDDLDLWDDESLPLLHDKAYPYPMGRSSDGSAKRPSPIQLTYMEAILRVATQLEEADALDDQPRDFHVHTFDGERRLTLNVAYRSG